MGKGRDKRRNKEKQYDHATGTWIKKKGKKDRESSEVKTPKDSATGECGSAYMDLNLNQREVYG